MDQTTQDKIRQQLVELAVPMMKVDFTRENYNKLFPRGEAKTPLGIVKRFLFLQDRGMQNR
jgi:hypothetical protein